jgi:antirestriction protein ArdC
MARKRLTEKERAERRARDRARIEESVRELQTSAGWRRWVAVRRHNGLARYSLHNQLLLTTEACGRRMPLSYVAGYRWWAENGYQVRRGERGLTVLAPIRRRLEDDEGSADRPAVVGFRGVAVFDRSQVEAGPDAVALEPPAVPIEGDSHECCLDAVAKELRAEGIAVEFGEVELAGARGYYEPKARRIVVASKLAPNARLRVLLHEGAHALLAGRLGIGQENEEGSLLSYAEEECVVEVAGHVAAIGLDTSGEAVPYVAGWGESGALAAVERAADAVDRIAGWLSEAAGAEEAVAAAAPSPYGLGFRSGWSPALLLGVIRPTSQEVAMPATTTTQTPQTVELGRYVTDRGEERLLVGRRVDGVVHVYDRALRGDGDRTYLVESGLETKGELAMLLADYRRQAERLGCIPMSRAVLRRLVELEALAEAVS